MEPKDIKDYYIVEVDSTKDNQVIYKFHEMSYDRLLEMYMKKLPQKEFKYWLEDYLYTIKKRDWPNEQKEYIIYYNSDDCDTVDDVFKLLTPIDTNLMTEEIQKHQKTNNSDIFNIFMVSYNQYKRYKQNQDWLRRKQELQY